MKIKTEASAKDIRDMITTYFDGYNMIHNSQVTNDTYFMVVEKFFLRNSSRASLSIVISENEYGSTNIVAVGSGGGQGWLFKFDWGAAGSFEGKITNILEQHHIPYHVIG